MAKAFNSLQFPRHEHILASFRAAAAGVQTANTEGPGKRRPKPFPSARPTMVMAARMERRKRISRPRTSSASTRRLRFRGLMPKFATPNVGRLDRAHDVLARVRRPEGCRRSRMRPAPAQRVDDCRLRAGSASSRRCSLANRPRGIGRDHRRSWRPRRLLGLRQDGLSSPMVAIPRGRAKRKWRGDRR